MADWRYRGVRCPRCKNYKCEPVNLHQPPVIHEGAGHSRKHPIYEQQCHACTMIGVSQSLAKAYGETWSRIKALCDQKQKAGVDC